MSIVRLPGRVEGLEVRAEAVQAPVAGAWTGRDGDRTEAASAKREGAAVAQVNAFGWVEAAVLAGYALLAGIGIRWHEPWADEAQAWLMARDLGWRQMMLHGVRYEGSPGLWHSILWVLARLHVSYAGMHWVSGGFALAGVFVLLRYAPFPRLVRSLVPFTFFLCYQDAVVARSYVLFALLAFGAAALLQRGERRPWLLACVLGLLGNLSVHGLIASAGMAMVMWALWRRGRVRAGVWVPGTVLLLSFWAFAVVTTFPPRDVDSSSGMNVEQSLEKIRAELTGKKLAKVERAVMPGELTPIVEAPHRYTPAQAIRRRVVRVLSLITFPLSSIRVLALAAFVLVMVHGLWRRRGKGIGRVGVVPYLLMMAVFLSLYLAPRHAGTLFTMFLVTAWLTWPEAEEPRAWRWAMTAVLALVCVHQIWWTARALRSEVLGAYAPEPMTARFLAGRKPGSRVAAFYYHTVGVLPYFGRNIFENEPAHAYWWWSANERTDQTAPAELRRRPQYVVVGGFAWGDNADITADWVPAAEREEKSEGSSSGMGDLYRILPYAEGHGYRETHRFCGHAWMRAGYSELLCDVVLEPVGR